MTTLITHLEQLGINIRKWPRNLIVACISVLED